MHKETKKMIFNVNHIIECIYFSKNAGFFLHQRMRISRISACLTTCMLLQAYSKINPMVTSHDETTNKPTQSNLDREHATINKVIGKTSDGI